MLLKKDLWPSDPRMHVGTSVYTPKIRDGQGFWKRIGNPKGGNPQSERGSAYASMWPRFNSFNEATANLPHSCCVTVTLAPRGADGSGSKRGNVANGVKTAITPSGFIP